MERVQSGSQKRDPCRDIPLRSNGNFVMDQATIGGMLVVVYLCADDNRLANVEV